MKDFTFLDFAREIGKHITVNYMMAKDSVQKRLNGEARDGLSFTEFTYQLLQGYDFLHLYETKGCKLQMGGSDQWGNITTGAELIRRTNGGEVFALTCPLITKADGGKFGKTESGNIWLDPRYTSPYKFYQFWLNVSDEDAARYIKIFTSLSQEEVEVLTAEHAEAPHLRVLQKRLAKEVTVMVHSEEDYNAAVEASGILFGNATSEALKKLDEDTLLAVFEGVPQFEVSKDVALLGIDVTLCVEALDKVAVLAQCFEAVEPDARHDAHIEDDVDGVGDFDADAGEGGTDATHRIRDDVHRSALHLAAGDLAEHGISLRGVHPIVGGAGVLCVAAADERARFDAGNVVFCRAVIVASGELLLIEAEHLARAARFFAKGVDLSFTAVDPNDLVGLGELGAVLHKVKYLLIFGVNLRHKDLRVKIFRNDRRRTGSCGREKCREKKNLPCLPFSL